MFLTLLQQYWHVVLLTRYCCSKHLTSCIVSWIAQNWTSAKHKRRSLEKRRKERNLPQGEVKVRKNTEPLIPARTQTTEVLLVPRKVAEIKKSKFWFIFFSPYLLFQFSFICHCGKFPTKCVLQPSPHLKPVKLRVRLHESGNWGLLPTGTT